MNDLKTRLSRVADELAEISNQLPDEEARTLRNASYIVEDIRLAVGEMVQVAAHKHGAVGLIGYHVLRERAAA